MISEEELLKRYNAAMARGDISTEEVFAAAAIIIEEAKKEGVEWALAGGLALHLPGCPGVTQNGVILGSAKLNRESKRKLAFGGESYSALVGEREVDGNSEISGRSRRGSTRPAATAQGTNPRGP